jgi:hypothetical protein
MAEIELKDVLKKQVVFVRPVIRKGSVFQGKDGEFLYDGAKKSYSVPKNANNAYVDPLKHLSVDEKKSVAEALSVELKDLNINNPKCYWYMRFVSLERDERKLDLSNLNDYITWCILKSNTTRIAQNWKERLSSAEYEYVLVSENDEVSEKVSKVSDNKKAYMLFGKIEENPSKMRDFLFAYYLEEKAVKKLPANASKNELIAEVGNVLEKDAVKFIKILEDVHFQTKVLIMKSLMNGSMYKEGYNYGLPGLGIIGTIEEMMSFLEDKVNNQERIRLTVLVEQEEGAEFKEEKKIEKELKEKEIINSAEKRKCKSCGVDIPKFPLKEQLCKDCIAKGYKFDTEKNELTNPTA